MIIDLLFVYGSLLTHDNGFTNYLKNNSVLVAPGTFKGKLFDLGEYPGAVAYPAGDDVVHGTIVKLNEPKSALKLLDDYEGFGPGQQQPNLFIRERMRIETDGGTKECWVYLYNLPVAGYHQIQPGDYSHYLKQKKR